jgi:HTH-type transcriptional regulator / antitoxin HipB
MSIMDDENFPLQGAERIAEGLRARRKELKLSQAEIAGLAGLLPKTVSALENEPERCSLASFLKLANYLGLEVALSPRPEAEPQWPLKASSPRSGP